MLNPTDPAFVVITIAASLFGLILSLLLAYLVTRLAITHGMLAYSRRLEEERHGARYRG